MEKKTEPFAALVKRESTNVVEALQAGGHIPDVDPFTAEPIDWIRILHETVTELLLDARFELSDPENIRVIRRRLAKTVAICHAWDKQLD
jgi:hypothetical protein